MGLSFAGSLRSARSQYQRGEGDRWENVHRLVLTEDASQLSLEYRQARHQNIARGSHHTGNSEGVKDIHKYVDNFVENSKPTKSDHCPALASLNFDQKLGNYLTIDLFQIFLWYG